mmetsp:Transcript_43685/g.137200  ORF Transcript_43685/g.137200 Transcript_43685/m.137200 type:complete len:270 (+) Transcript_43685:316-1125(+)
MEPLQVQNSGLHPAVRWPGARVRRSPTALLEVVGGERRCHGAIVADTPPVAVRGPPAVARGRDADPVQDAPPRRGRRGFPQRRRRLDPAEDDLPGARRFRRPGSAVAARERRLQDVREPAVLLADPLHHLLGALQLRGACLDHGPWRQHAGHLPHAGHVCGHLQHHRGNEASREPGLAFRGHTPGHPAARHRGDQGREVQCLGVPLPGVHRAGARCGVRAHPQLPSAPGVWKADRPGRSRARSLRDLLRPDVERRPYGDRKRLCRHHGL